MGPRSFDLLLQLLKRAGEFVSKEELLATVWAGLVVEEGSVRVHVSTLRKVLGEPGEGEECKEWISSVPQRGYRFNGRVWCQQSGAMQEAATRGLTSLPLRLTELVGREGDLARILDSLAVHRLVTIVGTGGIGKTSAAVRAAEYHQRKHAGMEVAFVDLSPLISPDHVLGTMARSLGMAADLPDLLQSVVQILRGRSVLLLIDNCEHVVESLVQPIISLLTALPGVRILATSREPLRVTGEYVLRLSSLAVPDTEGLGLEEASRWPAVQLLLERAKAADAGPFQESHGPLLARMARQLDGIPLAIELVAARLGVQSIADLAQRLDDHMRLYTAGNRTAHPRHRTLAAALEWSINLLAQEELRLLRRLSVFRGRFDVESALRINADVDADATFDALMSLANKSLVSFDTNDSVAPYRLLDTTRSYAACLLDQSGERLTVLERHAKFMLDWVKSATAEFPTVTEQAWADRHAYRLDDVRFAIRVCLTDQADAKTAAALVSESAPVWFHLSQVAEYRDRAAATLTLIDSQPEPDSEASTWMNTALIASFLRTAEPDEKLAAACDRALDASHSIKVPVLHLWALWGRCAYDIFRGEYAAALRYSEALRERVPGTDTSAFGISRRLSAMANHFCGNFALSRQYSAAAIAASRDPVCTHAAMVGLDSLVAAQAVLCRTLWLQGDTTAALETARQAVTRAESSGHAVSLCAALYGACAVALWSGERELAGKWVPMMLDEARRWGLLGWLRYAECFMQGLQLDSAAELEHHVHEVAERLDGYDEPRRELLATFCTDWVDEALIARVARGEAPWVAAEVCRAAAGQEERRGRIEEAERLYLRAIETSRQQGAMAWELRAALSLARLWVSQGQPKKAAQLLEATCDRALPDSVNACLTQAQRLRDELSESSELNLTEASLSHNKP